MNSGTETGVPTNVAWEVSIVADASTAAGDIGITEYLKLGDGSTDFRLAAGAEGECKSFVIAKGGFPAIRAVFLLL